MQSIYKEMFSSWNVIWKEKASEFYIQSLNHSIENVRDVMRPEGPEWSFLENKSQI